VDDPRRVCRGERREELPRDRRDLTRREVGMTDDALRERLSVEILHDHVAVAALEGAQVEHLENVIAADLACRLGLTFEPTNGLCGVRRGVRDHHLDRNASPNEKVFAFVDDTHPARADRADDPVLAVDDLARFERHFPFSGYRRATGSSMALFWALAVG
jgi:hypothetical protein